MSDIEAQIIEETVRRCQALPEYAGRPAWEQVIRDVIQKHLVAMLAMERRDKWQLEWRPVVGWEDHYEVSNTGRIRKMDGTLLTQWANGDGYMLVRLSNPRGKIRVHRAVAEAFIPNPNSLPFVNHVDNDRAHNCDFNLEWCTQKENLDHSRKQGRMPDNYWVGKRSPNASLTDDIVLEIRQLYASGAHSYQALAEKFGISKRAIGRLINRESYADV